MAVSVGLALFNSRHFVRIGYSAWASWCTAPKGARGPCNLICKAKTVEHHFWNGTLFDEQVNGGILNTRKTTLSPEAQGSPGSSHQTSSSIQHREQKIKYTPTAPNVETGSSNPRSTPWKYLHRKYRGNTAVHCAQAHCVRYTPFPCRKDLSRTALMCSERLLIVQIRPGKWCFWRRGKADGKRQVKLSSMKRSVARAHHSMPCFISVAYLTESIQTYCVSCHVMYLPKQDFGSSQHCYWTRWQAHHVFRPGESSSFIPWFSPAVLL